MNETLNKALLDLQDSLGEIDSWAVLLQDNQGAAVRVMENASKNLEQLSSLAKVIEKESEKTLEAFSTKTGQVLEEVEELLMQYRQLSIATAELVDYLRSVNFPARLDKIDASVASIQQGIQNISDKLDRHKDSIENKIEKEQQRGLDAVQNLQGLVEVLQRRQLIFSWVAIILLTLTLGLIVFLTLR